MRQPIIAIDGPAASGKSSTAAAVADRLGMVHVDSGSLYRTAAWLAINAGVSDPDVVVALLEAAPVSFLRSGSVLRVSHAGTDVEDSIREPSVTALVSPLSAIPGVREWANRLLRAAAPQGGVVMDGRDIGTVVFPDAELKVFLTASPLVRARRRLRQAGQADQALAVATEANRLAERDQRDADRPIAPLRQAADARLLDTSEMSFTDVVDQVVRWARHA